MSLIKTSECRKCTHSHIDDTNKAKVIVHCDVNERDYIYGQYAECEMKKTRKSKTTKGEPNGKRN